MLPIKLQLPEDFLKEETRSNYTISSKMKEVWAVELDLLSEFDRICRKYNLKYFADSGTLIGAVRHSGFIPWDDDIDLVMMRKDYDILLKVAPQELKQPFFLQNAYSDEKYVRGHSQLRNSNTTAYIAEDIGRPYNKGIFIDIFVLDNLPDDEVEYQKYKKKIIRWWKIVNALYYDKTSYHTIKGRILGNFCKVFYKIVDYRKVYKHYENICAKYKNIQTKRVSYIAYSLGKEKHIWEKEWFESSINISFEFTKIPAPVAYDERLKKEYGDYMVIKHAPTSHGDVTLDANTPYKKYLNRKEFNNEKI